MIAKVCKNTRNMKKKIKINRVIYVCLILIGMTTNAYSSDKEIYYCGNIKNDLYLQLNREGFNVKIYDSPEATIKAASKGSGVLIISTNYPRLDSVNRISKQLLTQQGVPPDEHPWIEFTGSTQLYRDFRNAIRDYYKRNYPLTDEAIQNPLLNPGDGVVSRLCHEPKVALAVLNDMIAPYISSKKLVLLLNHKAIHAKVKEDTIQSVMVKDKLNNATKQLRSPYFVDATELGDLPPLTGAEFIRS